jgi:hypothetical protein
MRPEILSEALDSVTPSPRDALKLIINAIHKVVRDPTERERMLGHVYGRVFSSREAIHDRHTRDSR